MDLEDIINGFVNRVTDDKGLCDKCSVEQFQFCVQTNSRCEEWFKKHPEAKKRVGE